MPATDAPCWSYDEALALIRNQDDRAIRYEYADGALLVTPAPGGYQQRMILELFRRIDP